MQWHDSDTPRLNAATAVKQVMTINKLCLSGI